MLVLTQYTKVYKRVQNVGVAKPKVVTVHLPKMLILHILPQKDSTSEVLRQDTKFSLDMTEQKATCLPGKSGLGVHSYKVKQCFSSGKL